MIRQSDQSGAYQRPHPAPYPSSAPYQPSRDEPSQYEPSGDESSQYEPSHYESGPYQPAHYQPARYQPPAGSERGAQPGTYQPPMRYEEPMHYGQDQPGQGAPAGGSGQYRRPDSDSRERAAHYATFAEQDATYTRPRPPGARDDFGPQDETDPLNIAPLNIGNYS